MGVSKRNCPALLSCGREKWPECVGAVEALTYEVASSTLLVFPLLRTDLGELEMCS